MADLIEDFLNEAGLQISDLEFCQTILEKNPNQEDCWDSLYRFFDFVRSVSPFAGFMRSYRLADAAVREIKEYRINKKVSDVLPAVLAKYRRICEILSAADRLKREARESDEDILPDEPMPKEAAVVPSFPVETNIRLPDVTDQEKALDKREEELILWAQALTEQENALKDKENILFKEENVQEIAQEKVNQILKKLKEQEKIQSDLEECLAETRLKLETCQKRLADRESLQAQSVRLLETKDAALNEMSRTIIDMRQQLEKQSALSELREDEYSRALQEHLRENEELKNNLKSLEVTYSDTDKERGKIFSEYSLLKKEYQKVSLNLEDEKEEKELLLQQKRELEKQYLEVSSRILTLQDDLSIEREKAKHIETLLIEKTKFNEEIQSELAASGWPYDPDKYQKELASLSGQNNTKPFINSLVVLEALVRQIRMRSLIKLPEYFNEIAESAAARYKREYKTEIECDVSDGVDLDARAALEQMLFQLTENAFQYALPEEGEKLLLSFYAQEDGIFIHCRFSDNGTAIDFDRLYNIVQETGLIDKNVSLSRPDLLAYLFHNAVKGEKNRNGLLSAVRLLERAGGQISADFDDGLRIDFSIPKHFLNDKVLLFKLSSQLLAVPLTAVSETVVLKEGDIRSDKDQKKAFFYLKGYSLPVLILDNNEKNGFGLVIQSGAFKFLIPVEQILDTEYLVALEERQGEDKNPYFLSCTVLESGRKPFLLDIAGLLRQVALPLSREVLSFAEKGGQTEKENVSYLIYKSEPNIFGAVRVNYVLKVEDFVLPTSQFMRKKYWETDGKKLPLNDSCPRAGFPHAQAVLIFEKSALAVHEVADIVEIPNLDPQDRNTDFIVYSGRKVPVLKIDD